MRIIKIWNYLLLVIIFTTCKNKVKPVFDQVEHFSLDRNDSFSLSGIYPEKDSSEKSKVFYDVVRGSTPDSLSDSLFLKNLEPLGFVKQPIEHGKFDELINIITSKNTEALSATTDCVPVYRDILVFRQNYKAVAVIKICFDCYKHKVVSQSIEWPTVGSNKNFEALYKLLYNKPNNFQ